MNSSSIRTRNITRYINRRFELTSDALAIEEPLEIRITKEGISQSISITMRTPGNDEGLAAGFLFTEGIARNAGDIIAVRRPKDPAFMSPDPNVIEVELSGTCEFEIRKLSRHFYTSSSCGVCGKSSIDAIRTASSQHIFEADKQAVWQVDAIGHLPDKLRQAQNVFAQTGGLHASALFNEKYEMLSLQEDVGRHNALDKLIGSLLLSNHLPKEPVLLLLSGRASFELVQKAVMAGISTIAAVGAPSSLAVELAAEFGVTLIGFLRQDRMNIYTCPERIIGLP